MEERTCNVCGEPTRERACCGVVLERRWTMTTGRVKAIRRYAHGRKGLTEDDYRLRLNAVGAKSTLELTEHQFNTVMAGLRTLRDVPRPRQGRAAR